MIHRIMGVVGIVTGLGARADDKWHSYCQTRSSKRNNWNLNPTFPKTSGTTTTNLKSTDVCFEQLTTECGRYVFFEKDKGFTQGNLPMEAIIEIPLKRRKYEIKWAIPARTIRFSVSSPLRYPKVAHSFAEMLMETTASKYRLIIECKELYDVIPAGICQADGTKFVDVDEHTDDLDAVIRSFNCVDHMCLILRYSDVYYSICTRDNSTLRAFLTELSPVEFYITLWEKNSNVVPVQLEAEPRRGEWMQLEQYYLENLGRYAAAIFLAPHHVNMEIMVVDKSLSRKLFDIVMKLCQRNNCE